MSSKVIELENRTRSVWRFPIYREQRDGRTIVLEQTGEVVLGDVADRDRKNRDPKHTPSPVAHLTEEEYAALGAKNHAVIDGLVRAGQVVRRELAA